MPCSREAPAQVVVDQADRHGSFADGRGDAFDRPAAHVANREDPGNGGFQRQPPGSTMPRSCAPPQSSMILTRPSKITYRAGCGSCRRYKTSPAVTAAVSRAALDAGAAEVLLFTDLANPTSNSLYQNLGYHPAEDRVVLSFTAHSP